MSGKLHGTAALTPGIEDNQQRLESTSDWKRRQAFKILGESTGNMLIRDNE
jgi:hypothetical protein